MWGCLVADHHCGDQSITQSKLVTPRCRWDTPTDASPVIAAHRRLSSATRSNAHDIDWSDHSLMLSFHDLRGLPLRRLPSMVPCSMIFGSISWLHTWPNYDNSRRLTVGNRGSWCPARILNCCQTYSLCYALCVMPSIIL